MRYMSNSNADLLIIAAALLTEESKAPFFTFADLTVEAWKNWHVPFCLKGHPEHPDSHKIAGLLMGARGLVRKGFLKKHDGGRYRLSEIGKDRADWLRGK